MRRIYYAYAISLSKNPAFLKGMAFSVSLGIFAELVHVASLINNLMQTQLGNIPTFVFHAFARGEWLTIMAVGVMAFVALSVPWQLLSAPRLVPRRVLSH